MKYVTLDNPQDSIICIDDSSNNLSLNAIMYNGRPYFDFKSVSEICELNNDYYYGLVDELKNYDVIQFSFWVGNFKASFIYISLDVLYSFLGRVDSTYKLKWNKSKMVEFIELKVLKSLYR